jgi:translation elongation factor EF-4
LAGKGDAVWVLEEVLEEVLRAVAVPEGDADEVLRAVLEDDADEVLDGVSVSREDAIGGYVV